MTESAQELVKYLGKETKGYSLGPKGKTRKVFLGPRLVLPKSSDFQLTESSKGLAADTSRVAEGSCPMLEVERETSPVGRGL